MTVTKKNAPSMSANSARGNDRNTYQGETTMNQIISVWTATDKDWNGHTVTTAAGFTVKPDSLMMRSLCNADEARADTTDRARYFVNAGE